MKDSPVGDQKITGIDKTSTTSVVNDTRKLVDNSNVLGRLRAFVL